MDYPAFTSSPTPSFDARGDGIKPSLIIIHYTNTPTADEALARYHDQNPADGFGRLSPHYLIGQDGHIWQLVDEEMRAWHAGVSSWKELRNLNAHSVGIELAGLGESFPAQQISALVALVQAIRARWDIPPESVLGHNDIAPGRKTDPGPHFPWAELAPYGVGIWPETSADMLESDDFSVDMCLKLIGYTGDEPLAVRLEGFQTHFVPEVFVGAGGSVGKADDLTCQRLFAMLQLIWQE